MNSKSPMGNPKKHNQMVDLKKEKAKKRGTKREKTEGGKRGGKTKVWW